MLCIVHSTDSAGRVRPRRLLGLILYTQSFVRQFRPARPEAKKSRELVSGWAEHACCFWWTYKSLFWSFYSFLLFRLQQKSLCFLSEKRVWLGVGTWDVHSVGSWLGWVYVSYMYIVVVSCVWERLESVSLGGSFESIVVCCPSDSAASRIITTKFLCVMRVDIRFAALSVPWLYICSSCVLLLLVSNNVCALNVMFVYL